MLNLDEYREVKHEWDTVPFVSVALVREDQYCPITHPVLALYDIWPGLDIMCYCEPSATPSTAYGKQCEGDASETQKCITREAIPTMYLGVINGYKMCGKRAGLAFKQAKRPVVDGDELKCPEYYVPCDNNALPATKAEALANELHPANFVICMP